MKRKTENLLKYRAENRCHLLRIIIHENKVVNEVKLNISKVFINKTILVLIHSVNFFSTHFIS